MVKEQTVDGQANLQATPKPAIPPSYSRSDRANFGSSTQVRHRIHRVN
ncbi:hypothetical protein [Mastigocladopsis repens]|nr:hypothetical protein [Mastigocladopsis repens]